MLWKIGTTHFVSPFGLGGFVHYLISCSYAHEDPTTLGSALEPVDIIALCGGLLPAAVAVAAQDTSELFSLAREILSVGIRLASQVNRNMRLIDQSPESWGITYTGVSSVIVQNILDRFHNDQVRTRCLAPSKYTS